MPRMAGQNGLLPGMEPGPPNEADPLDLAG